MIQKYKVVGQKGVLLKLLPYTEETTTESGIVIPLYDNYTTDGERPASKLSNKKFSDLAEVVQISEKAQAIMEDEKMNITVGDMVAIYPSANNSSNWFILNREVPVADFEGYLLLHPNYIQAKVYNNG